MRNISFAMTQSQIRAGAKTVTRRLGWATLRPGTLLQGVEKGQGLKKGEQVKRIRQIRVLSVRRERLNRMHEPRYGADECAKEGYPGRDPLDFVAWFCIVNRPCQPDWLVTRIEFDYVGAKQKLQGETQMNESESSSPESPAKEQPGE